MVTTRKKILAEVQAVAYNVSPSPHSGDYEDMSEADLRLADYIARLAEVVACLIESRVTLPKLEDCPSTNPDVIRLMQGHA